MNSLFSSFDALCAEFLGQAVGSNFAPVACPGRRSAPSDEHAPDSATKSRGAKPPPPRREESGRRSGPRFAPELDGLNIFETLVSC